VKSPVPAADDGWASDLRCSYNE